MSNALPMQSRKPLIDSRAGRLSQVLLGMAIAASAAVAMPCLADVIDIAPGGAAVTYAVPAVFTVSGVQAIADTSQARSAAQVSVDLSRVIAEAATRNQISPDLVTEVAWRESRFHQAAVSNKDAVGVMQLTASTARGLGVDRHDASQNIHGGAAYLRQMMDRYQGDLRLALAAYNAGPGAVDRYHDVPPFQETQAYVAGILSRLAQRSAISSRPVLFTR